jgi:hypothetical protein
VLPSGTPFPPPLSHLKASNAIFLFVLYHSFFLTMFQPTNNLGLPPEPSSLEELPDEQEPPGMGAGRDIVPNFLVLAADEVSAAPVQAEASTKLPVLAADEVPTPVQAGVGTEFILEDAAGSSYDQVPVLAADEVSAAPVQAGASTKLPVLAADEVSTPVQAGVGTEFILEGAAGSLYDQLPVLAADEVSAAPVQAGASTKLPVLAADEVSTPVQAGIGTEFILENASALSQLPALTADEVRAASVQAGASTNVSAQALPGTDIIHGEPEPVVVGHLQKLPFLTVNEFVPLDPRPPLSFLYVPPELTVGDGILVHDNAPPFHHPDAENKEWTSLLNPSLKPAPITDSLSCNNDVPSASASRHLHRTRPRKRKAHRDSFFSNDLASIASTHSQGRLRSHHFRAGSSMPPQSVSTQFNWKARRRQSQSIYKRPTWLLIWFQHSHQGRQIRSK